MKLLPVVLCYSVLIAPGSLFALAAVESRTGSPVAGSFIQENRSAEVVADRPAHFMLKQIETLRQEVSELRGLIETQQHDIEKLRKSQQDFYLELDKRLQQLQKNSALEPLSKNKSVSVVVTPTKNEMDTKIALALTPGQSEKVANTAEAEKDAYELAYTFVRQKQYIDAIQAFQAYLERYPTGERAPNAYYWLGEVYMVQWETDRLNQLLLDKANEAFLNVTTQFPGHQKAADSLLKLGMIQSEKGDGEAARRYFTEVKDHHPGTAAARIAETRLQQLN